MYKKSSTNFETSRKIRPDLMRMIRSTRFDEDSTGFDGKDRFWHHTDICPPWVDDGIVRQSRMRDGPTAPLVSWVKERWTKQRAGPTATLVSWVKERWTKQRVGPTAILVGWVKERRTKQREVAG